MSTIHNEQVFYELNYSLETRPSVFGPRSNEDVTLVQWFMTVCALE